MLKLPITSMHAQSVNSNSVSMKHHLQQCIKDVICDKYKSLHLFLRSQRLPITTVQSDSCQLQKVHAKVVKCKMSAIQQHMS